MSVRCVAALFCLAAGLARGAERQALPGHIPAAARGLPPVGQVDESRRLALSICLPLQHTDELNQLLEQLYDPASPKFRQYLSPEEFARQFGPSEQDYAALSAFCRSNGLAVTGTHPNRTVLDVAASAGVIERVFQTKLRLYQHPTEGRQCYAPESEPSLDFAIPVLHVEGLNDFSLPRPQYKRLPARAGNLLAPADGSGDGGTYIGNDFRQAYVPGVSLTGSGQKVALVEFDGYYPADIDAYKAAASLTNEVTLDRVLVQGFNGDPGTNNGEVALDIQMAMSMAPGLSSIVVYETSINNTSSSILNRVATDNIAKQISSSWVGGSDSSSIDNIFKQYAAQGQSFFQSSGDYGAYVGAVDAPADDPFITVVGGTTLYTSGGAWSGETAWDDPYDGLGTGGGSSTTYTLPSWQKGISMEFNGGSSSYRNLPDVAMIADNVYSISDDGQTTVPVVGTSVAAPLWAAFTALVNEQAALNGQPHVGFLNPALYAIGKSSDYLSAFHDITTGTNDAGSANGYYAVAGYDLCTGWGTPLGSNTISRLLQAANGQVDHLVWSAITSPISTSGTVAIKLTAETISNTPATGFNGTVSLSAAQVQTNVVFASDFESGALSGWITNSDVFTIEIDSSTGAAGTSQSLTLIGGNTNDVYDGLSHALDDLTPDWVIFYVMKADTNTAGGYFVAGQSAYRTNSVFHFYMHEDGTMGLTDPTAAVSYVTNYSAMQWYKISLRLDWTNKVVAYYVNDSLVFNNIPFCNSSLTSLAVFNLYNAGDTQAWWDQIQMLQLSNTPIAITPSGSGAFDKGTWSGSVTFLEDGTNLVLAATASSGATGDSVLFDVAGTNTSLPSNSVIVMVQASPSEGGTVSGEGDYAVGTNDTLTATPNSGWQFSQWEDGNSQNPRTIVVPSSNVTYVALFESNSPPQIQGAYAGLFFESSGVAQGSSGSFTLSVKASGAFSGKLQNGGTRYSLSGKFDSSGHATVTNGPKSLTPLIVDLQLDMTNGTDRVSGTVSQGSWTSDLAGDRAVFSAKSYPAPQSGRYTMAIPGSLGVLNEPAGDGFGAVAIGTAGQISLAGSLADGTKISQSSQLSKYGEWPLYIPLYSGKGSVLSWITITNTPSNNLSGDLAWIRPAQKSSSYYSNGFATNTTVFGSSYLPVTGTNKVLGLVGAELVLTNGELADGVTIPFTLGAKDHVTSTNKLSLTFTASSGVFQGSLRLPGYTKTTSFSGVVLQNQTNGAGYFLGTNQGGQVFIQGQ